MVNVHVQYFNQDKDEKKNTKRTSMTVHCSLAAQCTEYMEYYLERMNC